MRFRSVVIGALTVTAFAVLPAARAATVSLCGPSVCYEYDNAQAAVALFGLPTLIGNNIIFTPTVFRAESQDGVGLHSGTNTDSVSATFVFDRVYTTLPGDEIFGLYLYEDGDYRIIQDGSVSGDLYFRAYNLNNLLENTLATDSFGPVSGDSGGLQLWNMSANLWPSAVFSTIADDLRLQIQNDLSAFTDANGERAWIQKKLVLNVTTVVPIPVPAAAWLFGSAIGLLAWVRRSQSRH